MFDLIWGAHFKGDPETLWQYDKDGSEIPFKAVLDRQDDLEGFSLVNRRSMVSYLVDLSEGTLHISRENYVMDSKPFLEPRKDMLRVGGLKYRLIYFREITRSFDTALKEVGEQSINYYLGFQYTDPEGHNQKRLMCINKEGQVVIN